jgi:hypothetical protein
LLSVSFSDDSIATPRTVTELHRFFPNAAREARCYSPRMPVRSASGTRVSSLRAIAIHCGGPVFDWLDSTLGMGTLGIHT